MPDAKVLPTVQVALAQAAKDVGAIPKDDLNKDQGFKYRGIERILAGVGPALHKAGVVVIPKVTDVHREEMLRGAQRNVWRLVTLTVEYAFVGPAGDSLTATVVGEGLDNADKAVSKAMTMAYKVALLQALQIADADSDPDATTPPEQPGPDLSRASRTASDDNPLPQAGQPVVSEATADSLWTKATEAGMAPEEIQAAVKAVTDGRTDDVMHIYKSEVPKLRRALAGES